LTFWWPVGLVLVFGLACLFVIVYRVITFNDCEEASKELQQQIKEAQEDLKSKGLKF
jgi:dolichyl-phosphate mannosyltransferase polypeptide 3